MERPQRRWIWTLPAAGLLALVGTMALFENRQPWPAIEDCFPILRSAVFTDRSEIPLYDPSSPYAGEWRGAVAWSHSYVVRMPAEQVERTMRPRLGPCSMYRVAPAPQPSFSMLGGTDSGNVVNVWLYPGDLDGTRADEAGGKLDSTNSTTVMACSTRKSWWKPWLAKLGIRL